MNTDQYKAAQKILEKKRKIENELKLWNDEIKYSSRLGYLQAWNNNHATKLDSSMNEELFMAFRLSVINDLQCQIMRLDAEFSEI